MDIDLSNRVAIVTAAVAWHPFNVGRSLSFTAEPSRHGTSVC